MSAVEHAMEQGDEGSAHGGIDWWLLSVTVGLCALGLLMILSASSAAADAAYGDGMRFVNRQGVGLLLGGAMAIGVMQLPWAWLRRGSWGLYAVSLVTLGLVLTPLGHSANGAVRWISLGGLNFQPSELAKLSLVLVLAHFLAANEGRIRDLVGTVGPAFGLVLAPAVLVMLEPDFGTTVVLFGLFGVLLFVAGLQWRWVLSLGAAGIVALGALAALAPYRVRRLAAFADPFADPEDSGYQIVQGWIAMAHGGLWGQGLGGGVAQSGFLPEAHTDAIAAILGEELGAVGWCVMVGAYLVLVWRGSVIASRASDLFGILLASGVTALFAAQALVNLGVVVGWVPNKGLVLPLLSYGASAAMVHLIGLGLLQRVGLQGAAARGGDR